MFKTMVGSWECPICSVTNTSNANACVGCGSLKACVEQRKDGASPFTSATPSETETEATTVESFSVAVKPQDGEHQSVQPGSGNIPTAPSTKAASGGFSFGSACTSSGSIGFVFPAPLQPFSVAPKPKDGEPQVVRPASENISAVSSNSNAISGFSFGSAIASPVSSSFVFGVQKPKDLEPQPVRPASGNTPTVSSNSKASERYTFRPVFALQSSPAQCQSGVGNTGGTNTDGGGFSFGLGSGSKAKSQSSNPFVFSSASSSDNRCVASSESLFTFGSANTLAVAKPLSSCGSPGKNVSSSAKGLSFNDKAAPATVTAAEPGFQFGSTPAITIQSSSGSPSTSTIQSLISKNEGDPKVVAVEVATSVEPKETECPVCHGEYNVPKILPCGHDLCRDCLLSWLEAGDSQKCPICRCAIIDPEQRASNRSEETAKVLKEIVDRLQTNFTMEALVESTRLLSKDHVCCVCDDVKATSLCLHCGDTYCQSCAKAHLRMSMSRHHKVESLASLTPEILSANRPTTCNAHSDRPSEVFCPTHSACICMLCATTTHQECLKKMTLETKVREARAALGDIMTQLGKGEREMDETVHRLDKHLLVIDQNTQTALADINAACERLKESLTGWRHRVKELVKGANYEEKAAVHTGKVAYLDQRAKFASNRRLAERVKQATPPDKLDEMTNTLKTRIAGRHSSSPRAETRSVTADVPAGATGTLSPSFNAALPQAAKRVRKLFLDPRTLNRIKEELKNLGQLVDEYKEPADAGRGFRFHNSHGENIVLSDNHQTAERVAGDGGGIVLSNDPMVTDTVYQVQVMEKYGRFQQNWSFITGVTNGDPASLTLPYWAYSWSSAHVIDTGNVTSYGQEIKTQVGKKLDSLSVGSRVGLLVDRAGSLHLYKDGIDLGVAVTYVRQPCYAFFEVNFSYRKIKALPVTVNN